jgi:hypothetical protein
MFEAERAKLDEAFGSPAELQMFKLHWCQQTGTPCDITFFDRKPLMNVQIAKHFRPASEEAFKRKSR